MAFRSTFVELRRGEPMCSPVVQPSNSTIYRYYGTNLQLCSTAWGVTFLLRQESDQSPPKKGDLGEALRLCCGNTSTFRHYPRQPKFALPQDPLPRCAKSLYCISRFCKLFGKFLFDGIYIPNPCQRHTSVFSP